MAFFIQKEVDMGQFNVSVQTTTELDFELVPQNPSALEVDMPFMLLHTPNIPSIRIDDPKPNVLYLVAEDGGSLRVEEVGIGS